MYFKLYIYIISWKVQTSHPMNIPGMLYSLSKKSKGL